MPWSPTRWHVADHGSAVEPERFDRLDEVRLTAAALLGVPATDVAFVKNTTEGLAFVAEGLDLRPGQRVIVPDREFPSTLFPFLALRDRGVRVDLVQPQGPGGALPLEAFAAALDEAPTALVTVSWVQFGTGWRTDLEVLADLCHRHGALLCVDVIQGLGVLPCSLAEWGVDFAAADGHKWLLGPEGLGVLYVAAEHRDRLRVIEPGWASVAQREQWDDLRLDYDDSARRFEGGTLNVAGALGSRGLARSARRSRGRSGCRGHLGARRRLGRPPHPGADRGRGHGAVRPFTVGPLGHRHLHRRWSATRGRGRDARRGRSGRLPEGRRHAPLPSRLHHRRRDRRRHRPGAPHLRLIDRRCP